MHLRLLGLTLAVVLLLAPLGSQAGGPPPGIGDNPLQSGSGELPLVLDDGGLEDVIGHAGGEIPFLFLNRFTPNQDNFPLYLDEIHVYFSTTGQASVGDEILLLVYENPFGAFDPAQGGSLRATYRTAVLTLDAWSVYILSSPLRFSGPGDVMIGVLPLETSSLYFPASLDQSSSQQRSWIGWWSGSPPATINLPPDAQWMLIDNTGFEGNWMVRGYGHTQGGQKFFMPVVFR